MSQNSEFKILLNVQKIESFTNPEKTTDTDAAGLILSHYFHYDGLEILKACYAALEDANFHAENEMIAGLIDKLEGVRS